MCTPSNIAFATHNAPMLTAQVTARRTVNGIRHTLSAAGGLYESRLVGENNRLHTVAKAELRQYVRNVRFDGRFADDELRRDFGVRESLGDQPEDFDLARRELVDRGGSDGRRGTATH